MAQSIKFTDPKTDTEYTLEYDRDSVRFAEELGVNIIELIRGKVKPATLWTQLFFSALHKNHPTITQDESDDIWTRVTNKADVASVLQDMIAEPYELMLSEDEDADPKNAVTIKLPQKGKGKTVVK